jgi:hypothetical protein
MGHRGNSLVIVFSIVLLLSLVVMSFETADAQKDPDKDKKKGTNDKGKYPYDLYEVKCIGTYWWLLVYTVTGPNEKHQIFEVIIQEKCDQPPPEINHPYFILLKDTNSLTGETYTPSSSYVIPGGNYTSTGLPEVVAPVAPQRFFTIGTTVYNNLPTESIWVHWFPIVPDGVLFKANKGVLNPCPIYIQSAPCMLTDQWACEKEVTQAEYGYLFIGYPNALLSKYDLSKDLISLRTNGEHLKVVNKITCVESIDQSGFIKFSGTSEGGSITTNPVSETSKQPPGKEKEKTPKKRGEGVEPQGILTASGNYLPPVKQMKMGITAEEVTCNEGKELIFKSANGSPKCVSMVAAEKLVARGWATR